MWTAAALRSETSPYEGLVYRVVESQWKSATVRITDTLAEQELLEEILEDTKPRLPPEAEGFDFLLATPFRYCPYPDGSRFRRAGQTDGVFYAAESSRTAIAETAFLRLLFFLEAPGASLPDQPSEYSAISVPVRTDSHIDLTKPPLDRDEGLWTHLSDYGPCQDLADTARQGKIELIRYRSVRDPEMGTNVAVLSLSALAEKAPLQNETWHIFLRGHAIQAWCESSRKTLEYSYDWFTADPRVDGLHRRFPR